MAKAAIALMCITIVSMISHSICHQYLYVLEHSTKLHKRHLQSFTCPFYEQANNKNSTLCHLFAACQVGRGVLEEIAHLRMRQMRFSERSVENSARKRSRLRGQPSSERGRVIPGHGCAASALFGFFLLFLACSEETPGVSEESIFWLRNHIKLYHRQAGRVRVPRMACGNCFP